MRFTLALLASLMASTAFADRIAVPAAQHGIFDGGRIPPAAQGVMTFGASDGLSLTARPYSALPLSGTSWHGLLLHGLCRDGAARLFQWQCMGGCLRDRGETSMSSQYLARAEGLEIKKDIRTVEIDMPSSRTGRPPSSRCWNRSSPRSGTATHGAACSLPVGQEREGSSSPSS